MYHCKYLQKLQSVNYSTAFSEITWGFCCFAKPESRKIQAYILSQKFRVGKDLKRPTQFCKPVQVHLEKPCQIFAQVVLENFLSQFAPVHQCLNRKLTLFSNLQMKLNILYPDLVEIDKKNSLFFYNNIETRGWKGHSRSSNSTPAITCSYVTSYLS